MRSILSDNDNKIDAVIPECAFAPFGVLAALKEVGLDGKVAIVARTATPGTSTTSPLGRRRRTIWQDLPLMGTTAGEAAVALCKNPDISKLKGTRLFSSPGGNQIPSFLFTPEAITKDNLNVVFDAGFATKADVCAGVDPSEAPPACR